ncbi:alpha/beta hydrolase family protein [Streptomyces lavendofoliae]|uniref:alpha/beta hydrolase family protein n=1 Tax=Streptomyces lavendofoliae TaxID=67314 RepID=UPI00300F3384
MTIFERAIDSLLGAPAGTITASVGAGYGWAVHRHRHAPAVPGAGAVALHAGRLEIFLPDGQCWAPGELCDVLGRPVGNGRRFAGTAVLDGQPRCWIADVPTRRVQLLDIPAVLTSGNGAPVAWSGNSLVLPTPALAPFRNCPYVFEAEPGQRVRMSLSEATGEHLPLRYVYFDPASGSTHSAGVVPRGYRDVRATATGAIAAHAPGLVAVSRPGSGTERVIELGDAPLLDFQWMPELVWLQARADGFDIITQADGAPRLLHRHRGAFLHSHHEAVLNILARTEHAGYAVVTLEGDTVGVIELADEGAAPSRIVAARPSTDGGRRLAVVNARGDVDVWSTAPGASTAQRLSRHRPPADRQPVTVRGWDEGICLTTTSVRRPVTRAAAVTRELPTGRPDAQAVLHLPQGPARGTLIWLSQADPRAALAPDCAWLTLDGHAVLDLRLDLGWWPHTPPEQVRSRLVGQIRDTVLACDLKRHTGASFLAVGGTSFGATLALIALTDCELFSTGIAQSGAYSRQFTALGFQNETRTLWEIPALYRDFDAITRAADIRRPVLVIHGEADHNPATPLTQALLLFQALTANGTRTRLVVLPGEGHTVRSRQGLAAALAAKTNWLTEGQKGGSQAE